jgi:tetratricopeptide (TPR) repeat protein
MRSLLATLAAFSALSFAQSPATQKETWEEPLAQQHWSDAEPLLKQALAGGESVPALRGLVTVYRATGRIPDTDPILERLVALDETPANVEDLARVKASLNQLDRAEALYRRALALRSDISADPLRSIPVRQRLAQVLAAAKKFPEAEQEAVTAIALRVRAVGPQHSDVAGDYAALAKIYQIEQKWQNAAGAWKSVADIQAGAFGYDDLRLADTLDSFGECEYAARQIDQGAVDQAVDALRRALAIREFNLGQTNSEVARTTDQLGTLLYKTKRFADAEPYFRRSLDIFLTLLGPENPMLARSYDNLAVTEAQLEKYEEAEKLYRAALKLSDGENASSLRSLALILVAREKPADAEPLYRRALAVLDAPNNDNPDMLKAVLGEYADVLRDLKRPAEAAKLDNRLKGDKQVPQAKAPPLAAKQK